MAVAPTATDPEEEELWGTSTGMPDKFDATITEPFFGVDEKYNPDATLFCATLIDDEGEPITTIKYSVGQEWVASDDGSSVSHPTKVKVNNSSRFGRFIDRLIQPTNEKAPKRNDVISPKGKENGLGLMTVLKKKAPSPLVAKAFDGLKFHWEQHQMETLTMDENNKPVIKNVLLPTAFLGDTGKASSAKPAATKAATAKVIEAATAAAEETEEEDVAASIPIALRKKLTASASSSTAKEFVRAAARDAEVIALPDEITAYVLNMGDAGFWKSVQA